MFGEDSPKTPDESDLEGNLNARIKSRLEDAYHEDYHDTIHGYLQGICTAKGENPPAADGGEEIDIPDVFTPGEVAKLIGVQSDEGIDGITTILDDETSDQHHRRCACGYLGTVVMKNGDH